MDPHGKDASKPSTLLHWLEVFEQFLAVGWLFQVQLNGLTFKIFQLSYVHEQLFTIAPVLYCQCYVTFHYSNFQTSQKKCITHRPWSVPSHEAEIGTNFYRLSSTKHLNALYISASLPPLTPFISLCFSPIQDPLTFIIFNLWITAMDLLNSWPALPVLLNNAFSQTPPQTAVNFSHYAGFTPPAPLFSIDRSLPTLLLYNTMCGFPKNSIDSTSSQHALPVYSFRFLTRLRLAFFVQDAQLIKQTSQIHLFICTTTPVRG